MPKLRRRKWHGYSLTLLGVLILLAGGLFYVIRHRFNRVLEYVVREESKGRYAFRADQMEVSLWHRRIVMGNAALVCLDTANEANHYDVHIPEIYFSISSWRALLLDKKLIIDSFSVQQPHLDVYGLKQKSASKSKSFQPTDILAFLEQTLEHLNARSVSITNGSFAYRETGNPAPMLGEGINLSLSNFTHVNHEDGHIFGSDNVEFSLGKQDWSLDSGKQHLHFNRLSFTSKNQQVEIDSFLFTQKSDSAHGPLDIRAEKFFFNSRHLPAVYQKSELLIDTLFCLRPVFSVSGQEKTKPADAIAAAPDIHSPLFHRINIGFIDIVDGSLSLMNKAGTGQTTVAAKTNLRVYNFLLDPTRHPRLSTDSIRLNISKLRFLSADSLFQLDIDEFSFNKRDVVFSRVLFAPSVYNFSGKPVTFKAPFLILHDVNMDALMRKRIQAGSAELIQPDISYREQKAEGVSQAATRANRKAKPPSLQQILYSLAQLIDVPDFYIRNGRVSFFARSGLLADARDINAHILPNRFFLSDSLLDVKHAVPELRVGALTLKSENISLRIDQYRFSGIRQFNQIAGLLLTQKNGTRVDCRHVCWSTLDWDALQKKQGIQLERLSADSVSLHINTGETSAGSKKNAPDLQIGRLNIKSGSIFMDGPDNKASAKLSGVLFSRLQKKNQIFSWERAVTDLIGIHQTSGFSVIDVEHVHFDNKAESRVENFRMTSSSPGERMQFFFPTIQLLADVRSTDLTSLPVQSIKADKGEWRFYAAKTGLGNKKAVSLPLGLHLSAMNLNHIQISLIREGKDSMTISGIAGLQGNDIRLFKDQDILLRYGSIGLTLADMRLKAKDWGVELPLLSLRLDRGIVAGAGRNPEIQSAVDLFWKEASVRRQQDSSVISGGHISGRFTDPAFRVDGRHPLAWQSLVAKITLHGNDLFYRGGKSSVSAGTFSWSPGLLTLRALDMTPVLNREQSFKTARWQQDYMEVKGNLISIAGIRWPRSGDSLLRIGRVLIDGFSLDTYRDRRIPFRHGVEKLMPTKLINGLPFAFSVDSIQLRHDMVRVHEFSVSTEQWSEIPIEDINGFITGVSSRQNACDQLSVTVSAQFFRSPIRRFSYQESYADSLSYFKASVLLGDADLTRFSSLTMPMAALRIKRGHADTVFTRWEGNKYASSGDMHLMLRELKVKFYNKKDSSRWGLMPALQTGIVNLLLPGHHDKRSAVFVERDREKFVFNYWVKAQTSGFLSSLGIRSEKKYQRQYRLKAPGYGLLPVETLMPGRQ